MISYIQRTGSEPEHNLKITGIRKYPNYKYSRNISYINTYNNSNIKNKNNFKYVNYF